MFVVDAANAVAARIVGDVVRRSTPDTFEELVQQCGGLFPAEIARAVRELDLRTFPRTRLADVDIATPVREPDRPIRSLAVPHPLDFDWRFDDKTAVGLALRAATQHNQGTRWLLTEHRRSTSHS